MKVADYIVILVFQGVHRDESLEITENKIGV